jgi:phosphoglycerate kinase
MDPIRRLLAELAPGVGLLENLRFDPGEESNDPAFVATLVAQADLYVNDAFGAAHRNHASIVGPPAFLPSAAGRLLEKEVKVLGDLREGAKRPFIAVLGGSKVSDKLGVIQALKTRVDAFVVGGGMCFTFLAAKGYPVGDSLCERDQIGACKDLLAGSVPILLPEDIVGLDALGEYATFGVRLPDGAKGLDIGPGWAAAERDGDIPNVSGDSLGGHAVCLCGYDSRYVHVLNSWGHKWSWRGFCRLSYEQLEREWLYAIGVDLEFIEPENRKPTSEGGQT